MRFSLLRQGLRPGVQSNHHVMGIATIKNHPFENNFLKVIYSGLTLTVITYNRNNYKLGNSFQEHSADLTSRGSNGLWVREL